MRSQEDDLPSASPVLAYAVPEHVLRPLLTPGLKLYTYDGFGFLAIAMAETRDLRPPSLPAAFAMNFFLARYPSSWSAESPPEKQ
jgi:hypothetical protein